MQCGWCENDAIVEREGFPLCGPCAEQDDRERAEIDAYYARWASTVPGGPKVYGVQSGDYLLPGFPEEPSEWVSDFAYVRASNAKRARVLAVRHWRRMNDHKRTKHWQRNRSVEDNENPFRGLKAIRIAPLRDTEGERADNG